MFAEQGFGGASVADISSRAGFTRGASYSNFASTEELFLGLWDSQATAIVTRVRQAVDGVSGADDPVAAALGDGWLQGAVVHLLLAACPLRAPDAPAVGPDAPAARLAG